MARRQVVGTTLGDIRTSHPTAYLITHGNPAEEFRASGYVLVNGAQYDLIVPPQQQTQGNRFGTS